MLSKCMLNAHTFAYYGCLGFCKAGAFAVKCVVRPMIVVTLPCWAIEHPSANFLWPLGLQTWIRRGLVFWPLMPCLSLSGVPSWFTSQNYNNSNQTPEEVNPGDTGFAEGDKGLPEVENKPVLICPSNAGTVVSSLSGTSSCSMNLMKMVPASKLQKPCQMSGWCQCHASAISPNPGSGEIEIGELRKYLVWKILTDAMKKMMTQ